MIANLIVLLFGVSAARVVNLKAEWARSILPHEIDAPIVAPLPRISVFDLNLPQNIDYRDRSKPFILTGAMDGWPALEKWMIGTEQSSYLENLFPREVAEYYPYNMLEQGSKPFLFRFGPGVRDVVVDSGRFNEYETFSCPEIGGCKYIHLQLTPSNWKKLEKSGDVPPKRHPHLEGDKWWMRRCLKDRDVLREYHLKTHWKMILIGSRGSGMFNHTDSLMTSSWHGHVQGKKWWYVCSPDGEQPQRCYESVLEPGEVLYYGSGWYHSTRNLETPSMTITGTVINKYNFNKVADKLLEECAFRTMGFSFSGKLCDALDTCYPTWYTHLTGHEPDGGWPSWRSLASEEEIAVKDSVHPKQSTYDGRHQIGE
jgi:hypothetical protein